VVRPNEKGGAGYLGYEDKTFTIATSPDQWICTPLINPSPQPNTMNETAQPAPVGRPIRYLSVCSGMEAASVAWHPLGWTPVAFSEIEPFPSAILKRRFSKPNYPYDVPNLGSLTEYQSWPIEPGAIDLLVGGTPCQSFSVAGLRKGLTDPRGNLALTFLGLADKLKPRWIVWENVPGVLSSNGGRDFGSFVGALGQLGYGWAMRILDAQYVGGPRAVPQRRRRVFVVACLGDWRAAAEVLSLREGLRGYLETGNKKRKGSASDAGASVEAGGLPRTVGTICADTHPGAYTGQDAYTGRLIPAINPATNVQPYTASSFAQYAEGVGTVRASGGDLGGDLGGGSETLLTQPTPFRKSKRACSTTDNETRVLADSSNTLNNFDLGDTRTTHAVVQPIPIQDGREMEKKQNGLGIANQGDPAYTIDTTGAQAIAIQGTIIGRGENAGPQGTGATEGGPMFTLTKTDVHGVCHQMPGSVAPTIGASGPPYSRTGNERVEAEALAITFQPGNLRREAGADPSFTTTTTLKASAGDQTPHVAYPVVPLDGMNLLSRLGPCGEEHSLQNFEPGDPSFTLKKGGNQHGVLTPMAVRRLTPVECERLQGFPDNWSRISWKGKPEEDCPDGPRYKACGNSMAVPVMRWIGERIAAVDATLPSHA
jgi:DNA (cytosine-5)-methyltransferase 1